jgi:hypothetical protein
MRRTPRLVVVAAAVATALLAAPAARAQSAFDQLKEACRQSGANCNPSIPDVPAPTRVDVDPHPGNHQNVGQRPPPKPPPPRFNAEQYAKVQLTGMLLEGLIQGLFSSGNSQAQAQAAQAAEAERQRQELLRFQQRAAQVQAQRAAREQEGTRSMEDLASALADPWIGVAPKGGAPPPVQITGRGVVTPPGAPLPPPPPPPAPESTGERLARLAAENGDLRLLVDRLDGLEVRLAELRARTMAFKREQKGTARELEYYGEVAADAVKDAQERGLSLAVDGFLSLHPAALGRLQEVQSNKRAWNRLVGMLGEADRGLGAFNDATETAEQLGSDARWLLAKRDLKEDVAFLARRLGGPYAQFGESILVSAQSIRSELQAWKGIKQGTAQVEAGRVTLQRIEAEYQVLVAEVKKARGAVAAASGIPASELVRAPPVQKPPTSIGSVVPPIDN